MPVQKKQHIFTYHAAGDANHPERWYIDDIHDAAASLMHDEAGQKLIIEELEKRQIVIPWRKEQY
jgi:hypothetical protein